jgi:hypothetical protein
MLRTAEPPPMVLQRATAALSDGRPTACARGGAQAPRALDHEMQPSAATEPPPTSRAPLR